MDSIIVVLKAIMITKQSLLQGIFDISGKSGSLYFFSYTSHVIYKLIVLYYVTNNNDVRFFWEIKVLKGTNNDYHQN